MDLGHGYLRQDSPTGRARRVVLLVVVLALLGVAAAAAILVGLPGSGARSASARPGSHHTAHGIPGTPAFVANQLGSRRAALPTASAPRIEARSEVTPGGFRVQLGRASVALSLEGAAHGGWTSYAGGAARATRFGQELVTVKSGGGEQLLQVNRRQGVRTWSWRLDTSGLSARLRPGGEVVFLGAGATDSGIQITPVQVLDTHGRSVTPKGLHWSLARRGGAQVLQLRLADSSLPVPYVIDPAVSTVTFSPTTLVAGANADWTVAFKTTSALASGNAITVTFGTTASPKNFAVPAVPTVVLNSGFGACTAVGGGGAQVATITLGGGGACSVGAGATVSLTVQGVTNPKFAPLAFTPSATVFMVKTTTDATAALSTSGIVNIVTAAPAHLQLLVQGEGTVAQGTASATCKSAAPPAKISSGDTPSMTLKMMDAFCNPIAASSDNYTITDSGGQTLKTGMLPLSTNVQVNTTGNPVITATDTTDGTIPVATSTMSNGVFAPNGSGTMTVSPTIAFAGSTNTYTFTYTAATGGLSTGAVWVVVPAGWSAPQKTTVGAAGYTTASTGAASVSISAISPTGPWTIKVTGAAVTLLANATLTITYGSGATATAPTTAGTAAFTTSENSIGSTVAALVSSPSVDVSPLAATQLAITSSPASATAGADFSVTVRAQDTYGNNSPVVADTGIQLAASGTGTLSGNTATILAGNSAAVLGSVQYTKAESITLTAARTSGDVLTTSPASGSIAVGPGAASTLVLSGTPGSVTAGNTGSVTVTALDAYGNTATGYLGTVAFSSTGTWSAPADYTFTGVDLGVQTFTYTLKAAGSRTIIATDTGNGAVTGTSPAIAVNPAAASAFVLSGTPASVTAGGTGSVTVTAVDPYGNTDTGFSGAVTFTSADDPQASLSPSNYTFTGGDAGVHPFTNLYTLKTAGVRTIAATSGSVTGTSSGITVNSSSATTMTAAAPSPTTAGSGLSVTVTAKDTYGNIATGYTGTVGLTSTDPIAVLPGPYTFVAGDNGSYSLPVTLETVGSQTVSASDGSLNATTGGVTVNPGLTTKLALSGTPGSVTAGNTGSVTVTAQDAYGNTTPAYTGTVTFTSSDGAWTAPSNFTFTGANAGVHTFTNAFTLKAVGSQTVTATDTLTSSITGTSAAITVNAAAPSTALSTLAAAPGSITANGTSTSTVTVQLEDAFGNNLSASGGTVALFTTTGSLSAVTDHADGTYTATLTSSTTASTASVTGTLNASALAASANVTFAPGPTTNFVASAPATATAGSGISVSVTAKDAFGNTTPAYTSTVNLTSTDPQAPTPGSHAFTVGDAGVYSFPVTLKTSGLRTVTASDGSSTGTTGAIAVSPAATTVLAVTAPATATAGTPISVTVTAQDTYGNTETGYLGTLSLTSTDPQSAALGSHAFVAGDAGSYVFSATLKTAGSQTVSAGDGALTGSAGPVTVSPAAVSTSSSTVTGAPASVLADGATPVTVTVTLKDAYGNAEPGKNVSVAATGSAAVSAATATNASGVATFTVTDTAVESSTFTAADTTDSVTLSQTPSASFVAGPLATIQISPSSSTVSAGVWQAYGVTGSDAYGHSLGAQTATFGIVPDGSCVNATASCSATVSGLHAVTATVSGHTSVASLTVSAGSGAGGTTTLAASPTTIVANGVSASTITVRLKDAYGNNLTSGGATVALSTTGGTLSAVTDNGDGTYSATLTASSPGSGTVSGTVNGNPISATAAVVFTNNDTTPPTLSTASATGSTLTLGYSETLDANFTPAPGDFSVAKSLSADVVTGVTVSGSSVVLTLTDAVVPGDLVTVSYSGTATRDLAGNAAATFLNQTVLTGGGGGGGGTPAPASCPLPLRVANDGHTCIPASPPPPPIKFLGASPGDGATPTSVDSISLTANHMSSWLSISVAGPDGVTTTIPSGFGVSYSVPFSATKPGAYTLTATMDDGFNPSQRITTHFTIVPALPDIGVPGKAGSLASDSGDTTVNWTVSTFTAPVRVVVTDEPSTGGSFGIGSRVVRVTVTTFADGTPVDTFAQPLELVFAAGPTGVPSFSQDGVAWSPVPKLTGNTLPDGQLDGYFLDSSGAVHVLTRHLTFFGVLTPKVTKSTKLAMSVSGSVAVLPGGSRRISVTVQMTRGARVVASLYSPRGRLVQTWTRTVGTGSTTLNLTLSAAKVEKGICTIVLQATSAGQTTQSAIPVTLH